MQRERTRQSQKNLARLRALYHTTRQIVHHNLQHTADLKEEQNRKAHPEAKWPSYKINQRVWHYIDAKRETNWKFGPSWEKAIIVGIPSTATYRIRREVENKKVKTVNMQKLKLRQLWRRGWPTRGRQERTGTRHKGKKDPGRKQSRGQRGEQRGREQNPNTGGITMTRNTSPRQSRGRGRKRRRTRHRIGTHRKRDDRIGR
jgi:hypothetical protein